MTNLDSSATKTTSYHSRQTRWDHSKTKNRRAPSRGKKRKLLETPKNKTEPDSQKKSRANQKHIVMYSHPSHSPPRKLSQQCFISNNQELPNHPLSFKSKTKIFFVIPLPAKESPSTRK